jgi:hypothetical protein
LSLNLQNEGIPKSFNPELGSLAGFLVANTRRRAVDYFTKLKKEPPTIDTNDPKNDMPDTREPESNASQSICLQLIPDAKIANQYTECAGLQLSPKLDWQRKPAPALRAHLNDDILTKQTKCWSDVEAAHKEAAIEYQNQRMKLSETKNRAISNRVRVEQDARLQTAAIRNLFQPLSVAQMSSLSGWNEYTHKVLSYYRKALFAGKLIEISLEPWIKSAFERCNQPNDEDK